jgi:hypothetical protein
VYPTPFALFHWDVFSGSDLCYNSYISDEDTFNCDNGVHSLDPCQIYCDCGGVNLEIPSRLCPLHLCVSAVRSIQFNNLIRFKIFG